jgi:hypothetical protein
MTKEQLLILAKLYNTMMSIETKGESTRLMSQCLNTLYSLISEEGGIVNGE